MTDTVVVRALRMRGIVYYAVPPAPVFTLKEICSPHSLSVFTKLISSNEVNSSQFVVTSTL